MFDLKEPVNLKLVFIKLGGSVLTDKTKPEALNSAILATIAGTIAQALREHPSLRLLIGHGGGSFGHYWAAKYATQHGVADAAGWEGMARVADAMGRLNRFVVAALLEVGVNAISVQPSASAMAEGGNLRRFETATLEQMLRVGLTPVVYGDVVLDAAQGAAIISTEELFAYLAPRLKPERIVLVGEAGVFTADPRRDATAQRIREITSANIARVSQQVGSSHGTDVTGGMATKVQAMWRLVQLVKGLEVQLVGIDSMALLKALRGEVIEEGTLIKE